jgi:hypothetical protein
MTPSLPAAFIDVFASKGTTPRLRQLFFDAPIAPRSHRPVALSNWAMFHRSTLAQPTPVGERPPSERCGDAPPSGHPRHKCAHFRSLGHAGQVPSRPPRSSAADSPRTQCPLPRRRPEGLGRGSAKSNGQKPFTERVGRRAIQVAAGGQTTRKSGGCEPRLPRQVPCW